MPTSAAIDVIAQELSLSRDRVAAVLGLMDEGGTVPFIARYRKEATGGLDEIAIFAIQERHGYLTELEKRRGVIRETIEGQGKLTEALLHRLKACRTKTELEDLYLPFKPKRKTRASVARERGLLPLAQKILAQPRNGHPATEAGAFVRPDRDVPDVEAALAGARDIVAEMMAERAELRAMARETYARHGSLVSRAIKKMTADGPTKFTDYYEYSEPVTRIPSHRFLAVKRGEQEGVLRVKVEVDTDRILGRLLGAMRQRRESPFAGELREAVADGLKRLLGPAAAKHILTDLKEKSDEAAVGVFAENMRNVLLAAPLGGKPVLGIDPGFRTGCKCAALDATGNFLQHQTIYPFERKRRDGAAETIRTLVKTHGPVAVAVGNGTASRETLDFVREALGEEAAKDILVLPVSEAGASVYSASETARDEFPDLDLTVRGAISIGRRLQDPLAELVKVEPKAVGVGQYQHDVNQKLLEERLGRVVETCVNAVGVELNTASAPLLSRVAGIRPALAKSIVAHRSEHGPFSSRRELLDVPRLGARAFEQAAGFLRIRNARNRLDSSAVHPERYDLVRAMARDLGVAVGELVGNTELAGTIDTSRYVAGDVGLPTLEDILGELAKPGRDPRQSFVAPEFRDDVRTLDDVKEGMTFTGIVTNVTNFGAFVDIGVHQDGLVHISQLANHYVKDPHQEVRAGQSLTVRVLSVDVARKRIALSARGKPDRPR